MIIKPQIIQISPTEAMYPEWSEAEIEELLMEPFITRNACLGYQNYSKGDVQGKHSLDKS